MIFTKFFEPFEQLFTEVLHEDEQSTLVVEMSKKYGSSSTSSTTTGTTVITTLQCLKDFCPVAAFHM